MESGKTYLVCPLNWGLGHASRMIPIILTLLKENHQVIIGGDGNALSLLRQEFPTLKTILIPDIKLAIKERLTFLNLISISFKILTNSIIEHQKLKHILSHNNINTIISDNRYGLWNKNIESIFVTHQLMLKLPKPYHVFEKFGNNIIKLLIKRFDTCWIPDYENPALSLTGDLSHKYKLPTNTKFIDPLSRFTQYTDSLHNIYYHTVALLSGPEPARSILEQELITTLQNTEKPALLIQGKPGESNSQTINNLTITSSISTDKLKSILITASVIICRSGYSTLMDLHYLNKKAYIIPTPGQTEQEYLAQHNIKNHFVVKQDELKNLFLFF